MDIKKYKKFFVLLFLVTVFLAYGQAALALEANYPSITLFGSTYRLTSSTSIVQFIQYVFVFLIAACGIIAVVSIAISGVKILVTAGSPGAIIEAKERILGAVLGIVLLFASVMILRTINPAIVNVRNSVEDLPGGTVWYAGVMKATHPDYNEDDCYWEGNKCWVYIQAPESEANTANIGSVYTNLFYSCVGVTNPKRLLVWKYNQTNFRIDRSINGTPIMTTEPLECGKYTPITTVAKVWSFKRSYENPGVYFYLKPDCKGVASEVYNMSGDILPFDDLANENQAVRSMRIVSGRDPRTIYGVVLSKDYNLEGECSKPKFNYQQNPLPYPGLCVNMTDGSLNVSGDVGLITGLPVPFVKIDDPQSAKYMHLLNFDKNHASRPESGVKLYSKDYVAELKQSNPTCTPPILPAIPATPTTPARPALCDIADGVGISYPDHILRLPSGTPPSGSQTSPYGIGARWTQDKYPTGAEEDFAQGKGRDGGGIFYNLYNALENVITWGSIYNGPKQCNSDGVECIEKIEHDGTYYTVLYSKNPRTVDRACTVITGTTELNTRRLLTNGRVIEAMAIIPTTP